MKTADGQSERPAGRTRIRALERADLPAVVALYETLRRGGDRRRSQRIEAYFEEIFFGNPTVVEGLTSLVAEEPSAGLVGFLGVVSRQMLWRGETIDVGVSNNLMVAEGYRQTLAGLDLIRAFLDGPQHLAISDTTNRGVVRLWERLGGTRAPLFSTYWIAPLRPARYALRRMNGRGALRIACRLATPLASILDSLLCRGSSNPFRVTRSTLRAESMSPETFLEAVARFSSGYSLAPLFDAESAAWLLGILERKKGLGTLRKTTLFDDRGQLVGCVLYYVCVGGTGDVLQIAAVDSQYDRVFGALCHDAKEQGCVALVGQMNPSLINVVPERVCIFGRDLPWMLVHAKDLEIITAVQTGDAFVTRLEGETWIPFLDDQPPES